MTENKVELKLGYNCNDCPIRVGVKCGASGSPCQSDRARELCAVSQRAYNTAIKNLAVYLSGIAVKVPTTNDETEDIL